MDKGELPDRQTFVIRLWNDDEEGDAWRGQLIHVPTGESWPFSDLSEIEKIVGTYFPSRGGKQSVKEKVDNLLKNFSKKLPKKGDLPS